MEYRHLGTSGLMVSEIAYGNWITHGDQVEEQAAVDCVRAALDEGITTFDTADAYAGGRAEEVLGRALRGIRRESLEVFTKVYWPTGDKPNDRVLTGKYQPGAPPPADSRATDPTGSGFIGRMLKDSTLTAVQRLTPLAQEAELSMAQLAVAWTLQNPDVSAAIIGATRPGQVRENVKAAGVRLEAGLMSRIDEALGDVVIRDPARTASPKSRP